MRFDALSLDSWRRTLAVNLDGVFLGCRWAVRAMAGRGGSVVNIGSAAGRKPVPDMAAYSASKAAVEMLTRTVALHCGRERLGIRCNAVLPGSVETPMVSRLRETAADPAAARARVAALHPIGFVGAPDDIAGAVAWLTSARLGS
jgi:3(or 17)beta-hydroxysteroid dehydrogenase